jgi:hypothetical protein
MVAAGGQGNSQFVAPDRRLADSDNSGLGPSHAIDSGDRLGQLNGAEMPVATALGYVRVYTAGSLHHHSRRSFRARPHLEHPFSDLADGRLSPTCLRYNCISQDVSQADGEIS